MDDIVIRGGLVIDGSGAPGRLIDVAVRDGHIIAMESGGTRQAHRIIDATGQVVAPGFIDIHTHSDFTLPLNPRAESKIRQGVTTEVLGNCGFSVAPALPGRAEVLRDYLAASAPWLEFRETTVADYMHTFPYQVPLDPDSRPCTAFSTTKHHYEFNRLSFGLKNAPSAFQRERQTIL
ncbi:MAG: amidohydrolase family protein, partial [Nitrospinae bacterium]|nr:amidohydrolase family protein [Nitrospinota bacterium]